MTDEAGITRVIEAAAREHGFEVLAINDTDEFEKALAQIRPTIIFLDIVTPGRDGMELISYLATGNYRFARQFVVAGRLEAHPPMSRAMQQASSPQSPAFS